MEGTFASNPFKPEAGSVKVAVKAEAPGRVIEMDPARRLARELETFLKYRPEPPEVFSPRWIYENNKGLYTRIKRLLGLKQGRGDWDPVIGSLPAEWQARWQLKGLNTKKRTFEENVAELQELLIRHSPTLFSPRWIEKTDNRLYRRLVNYRDAQNVVNWSLIIDELEDEWRVKWKHAPAQKKLEDHLPKETYRNSQEVDEAVKKHSNGLVNLLLAEDFSDKEADAFCRALISLTQKGNEDAVDRLLGNVMMVVQEWMDKYEDMAVYKNNTEAAQDTVSRCIYYFEVDKQGNRFMPYVLKSLRLKAKGMQKQIAKSLDQSFGDSTQTAYDKIGYDPETGEVAEFGSSGRKGRLKSAY